MADGGKVKAEGENRKSGKREGAKGAKVREGEEARKRATLNV
jgi:hypothetical protein